MLRSGPIAPAGAGTSNRASKLNWLGVVKRGKSLATIGTWSGSIMAGRLQQSSIKLNWLGVVVGIHPLLQQLGLNNGKVGTHLSSSYQDARKNGRSWLMNRATYGLWQSEIRDTHVYSSFKLNQSASRAPHGQYGQAWAKCGSSSSRSRRPAIECKTSIDWCREAARSPAIENQNSFVWRISDREILGDYWALDQAHNGGSAPAISSLGSTGVVNFGLYQPSSTEIMSWGHEYINIYV